MSISQRKFQALIGSYRDNGSSGGVDEAYVRQSSGDPDHLWWCARSNPTGRENTTGMKAEHRVDAVFEFAAAAPVTENGAIQEGGVDYLVRAVLPRQYGVDARQVLAERAPSALTWANS